MKFINQYGDLEKGTPISDEDIEVLEVLKDILLSITYNSSNSKKAALKIIQKYQLTKRAGVEEVASDDDNSVNPVESVT